MTLALFPTLPGITWDYTKTPTFSTRIQTAASGKEYRAANWSYPIWKFSLIFSVLRTASQFLEYQQLVGFCNLAQGQFGNFWYNDPQDNSATAQTLGLGNGTNTTFNLIRTLGGYSEPITAATISAVYLNGVAQATGWSTTSTRGFGTDTIVFATPPGAGVTVSADFTFYFTCRFLQDDPEFGALLAGRFECKKLDFQSVK